MPGDDKRQPSPPGPVREEREGEATVAPAGRMARSNPPALGSDIRLTLPARAENVGVVRHVLGALADALGLAPAVVADMQLAVTEACTNVVRHAYVEGDGAIEVIVRPDGHALKVIVADAGRGPGPSPDTAGPGLGLPLIAALADSLEIERTGATGSRLTMSFLRARPDPAMGVA